MVIKQKDDVEPALQLLEGFLALRTLTGQQRERIEDETQSIRAGTKGEKEAAYHVDFKLKDAKNWLVIHDLRLEHDGRVAQIDHLLIGRMFDIFVIESKNVTTAVRMKAGGEFEVKTRWGWKGMASPVEQNKRHIQVLSGLISDEKLTPTRLGFHIRPSFHNWVLLAPECNFVRGKTENATILKMDMFQDGLEKYILNPPPGAGFSLAKVCSRETIAAFAERLLSFHKPIVFDYAAKFGITDEQRFAGSARAQIVPPAKPKLEEKASCERCYMPVESKVMTFCRAHEKRFGGKILCRTCQTAFYEPKAPTEPQNVATGSTCQECGSVVDSKVVAFCRFNSRRFNKRVLCRSCQTTNAVAVG